MKLFLKVLVLVATVFPAFAQRQVFQVDPAASEVKITLNTNHEVVHGLFHVQAGSVEFSRVTPTISGTVSVLAGSGTTGNGTRDKRMNREILQVEQYAQILFAPRTYTGTIEPSGDSTIQVTGIFTLLNKPHEITVPMLVHLENGRATVKTHLDIPYVQWGLKDPSLLFWKAEKSVSVDLTLAGQLSAAHE